MTVYDRTKSWKRLNIYLTTYSDASGKKLFSKRIADLIRKLSTVGLTQPLISHPLGGCGLLSNKLQRAWRM